MDKKTFKELYIFLKPYNDKIFKAICIQVIIIACSLSVPFLLGEVIQKLEKGQVDANFLIKYLLVFIVIYLVWDVLAVILSITFEKINKGVVNDIRMNSFDKILKHPLRQILEKKEGEIISKVLNDSGKIEKIFSSIFELTYSVINFTAIVIMMFIVNVTLASMLITAFVIIVIIHRKMSKPLKDLYSKYKDSEESIVVNFRNMLSGFVTIKLFSMQKSTLKLLNEKAGENYNDHMKIAKKVSIIRNVNFFIISIFRISSVIVGGFLYLADKIYIGQIFAIHTYTIQLSFELRNIVELDIKLKDISTSFRRTIDFLENIEAPKLSEENKLETIDSIKFKDVDFGYGDTKILKAMNFEVNRGDIIAIKGENGSGKTTLTYLICGFYKAEGIKINGIDSNMYSEEEIVKHISYVIQSPYLFPATIKENLTLFGEIDFDDAIEICKELGIHDRILRLESGYDTPINERSFNVSGGERQLITIARALLKPHDVLILDEMNSALDVNIERELISNIKKHFPQKIVFLISHKKEILEICNKTIDLNTT